MNRKNWRALALLLCLVFGLPVNWSTALADDPFAPKYTGQPFRMSSVHTNGYGHVGQRPIVFSFTIHGGTTPYYADYQISLNGSVVKSDHVFCTTEVNISYAPEKTGDYKFSVTVKDHEGTKGSGSASISVAKDPRFEYPETWEKTLKDVRLTGNPKEDLIAVAKSQVGYTADKNAFVVKDGGKHFYSRYGEWFGAPYSEWCVMFISFCLHYANIPQTVMPYEGGVVPLITYMADVGALRSLEAGYTPDKGDVIFMDYRGKGTPTHAGIVDSYSDGIVYTVEGNTSQGVACKSYDINDPQIMGYGSFQALLDRAGL